VEVQNLPCIKDNAIDYTLIDSEVVKSIREQRHDFMNHIQVIWGYLQLKKTEEAVRYISRINKEYNIYSYIFKLGNPTLSLFLYSYVKRAYKLGIEIDFEAEFDFEGNTLESVGHSEIKKLETLFGEVLQKTLSQKKKVLYIDLFDEKDVLYIIVSNNSADECTEFFDNKGMDNNEHMRQAILDLDKKGINVWYSEVEDKATLKIGFK